MKGYVVIDNFLPKNEFDKIKEIHMSNMFPWYFMNHVANKEDNKNFYFIHTFYNFDKLLSNQFYFRACCEPLLSKIGYDKINRLIRIKSNLFTKTGEQIKHGMHSDYFFEHTTGVFSINTNNGYTGFEDGTKIESVENRMLLFNGLIKHQSVSQSDTKLRLNMNLNFIGK